MRKVMRIEAGFDCTQRQVVIDIAAQIYRTHGCVLPRDDELYLWKSQHPTEQGVLQSAEEIFEMFWGDSPDYSDDSEEIMQKAESLL